MRQGKTIRLKALKQSKRQEMSDDGKECSDEDKHPPEGFAKLLSSKRTIQVTELTLRV